MNRSIFIIPLQFDFWKLEYVELYGGTEVENNCQVTQFYSLKYYFYFTCRLNITFDVHIFRNIQFDGSKSTGL